MQIQKTADERAKVVDAKLTKIVEEVSGLRADFGGALKVSAEETGKALDRVLSACVGAIPSAMANKDKKTTENKSVIGDVDAAAGDTTADHPPKDKEVSGGDGSALEVSALPNICV